jgi:hypothetical protein
MKSSKTSADYRLVRIGVFWRQNYMQNPVDLH